MLFLWADFPSIIRQIKRVTHHSSTDLEKYIDIVDMQHLKKTKDGVKVLQLQIQISHKNLKVYCGVYSWNIQLQNESQNPS